MDTIQPTFTIKLHDELFASKSIQFTDRLVTGREIIAEAGLHPAEDYIVLRYRPDGALEEVGLEEKADLAQEPLSFFANRASESVNIVIDGVRLTWTQREVTGSVLLQLARKDHDRVEIYLESHETEPRLIEDDEVVDLGYPGVERFFTKPSRTVMIEVNNKAVPIARGIQTGASIKAAAIANSVNIQPSFTLSEDKSGGQIIGDTDHVRIKGGEKFLAVDDHDDS